jgi:galactokinase
VEVRAPGRVNLIGEHTDYSDGWCLPVAIDRECRIRTTPLVEPVVRARSAELEGVVELDAATGVPIAPLPRWGRFVAGAVEVVTGRGHGVAGTELAVHSTVPAGAGLSSSTALAVALVLALLPPDAPERADRRELARLALAAEVTATGVPGGLLDQMASLYGRAGHASLRDDFEVSLPELDRLVDLFVAHGAFGARLTGAGFGGCVIAIAPVDRASECLAATLAAYGDATGRHPSGFPVAAVAGAGTVGGPPGAQ